MSLPTDVSTNQLATLLGVSPQRINQLAAASVLQKIGRNKYPLASSIAAYITHREQLVTEELNDSVGTLTAARREWVETKNQLAALDLAERQAELVSVAELEHAWGMLMDTLRTHLLAIPSKLAPRLNAARSSAEAQALVRREIHDALSRISSHQFEAAAE
jgi:phage terminase Nu1 subunit (DNA packaging protein)